VRKILNLNYFQCNKSLAKQPKFPYNIRILRNEENKIRIVKMYCVDYCGYEETYIVPDSVHEDQVEDWAMETHLDDFKDQFDLQSIGFCEYTDSSNLGEDGELIDPQDVTTIATSLQY
jgi:hypothetical protein